MGNQCSGGLFKRNKKGRKELSECEHHTVPVSFTLHSKWNVVQNHENVFVMHTEKRRILTKYTGIDLSSTSSSLLISTKVISDKQYPPTHHLFLDIATIGPSLSPRPPYNIIHKKFFKLVKASGEQICAIEYSVRNDAVGSIEGLRNITDIKNLQDLTMYSLKNWDNMNVLKGLLELKNELDRKILSGQNGCLVTLGGNGFLPLHNPQNQDNYCFEGLKYSIAELTPNVRVLKSYMR